jgi:hypothetical protein
MECFGIGGVDTLNKINVCEKKEDTLGQAMKAKIMQRLAKKKL